MRCREHEEGGTPNDRQHRDAHEFIDGEITKLGEESVVRVSASGHADENRRFMRIEIEVAS